MKKTYIFAGLAAVVFGILLAVFLSGVSNSDGSIKVGRTKTTKVYVAKKDINPHTKLTEADVEAIDIPEDAKHPAAKTNKSNVVGHYNTDKIYEGEQIISNRLSDSATGGSQLSSTLDEEMAAMTIPVDEKQAVGGFITEGDTIDILSPTEGEVIEEDVKVLRVGTAASSGENGLPSSLTLALTKDACLNLSRVMKSGKIDIILNKKDE